MSVYFITARNLNICKIGSAGNVEARRASLQTASPVELVVEATLHGSRELEQRLHKRFAKHRVKGEWFTITEEIEKLIAEASASPVLEFPTERARRDRQLSDDERAERSVAEHRQLLAEAMQSFERAGCLPHGDFSKPTLRFYRPVSVAGGQFADHYAVRDGDRRILCADLKLTWDQADRLCDAFEQVRQRAMQSRQVPLDLVEPKRSEPS